MTKRDLLGKRHKCPSLNKEVVRARARVCVMHAGTAKLLPLPLCFLKPPPPQTPPIHPPLSLSSLLHVIPTPPSSSASHSAALPSYPGFWLGMWGGRVWVVENDRQPAALFLFLCLHVPLADIGRKPAGEEIRRHFVKLGADECVCWVLPSPANFLQLFLAPPLDENY